MDWETVSRHWLVVWLGLLCFLLGIPGMGDDADWWIRWAHMNPTVSAMLVGAGCVLVGLFLLIRLADAVKSWCQHRWQRTPEGVVEAVEDDVGRIVGDLRHQHNMLENVRADTRREFGEMERKLAKIESESEETRRQDEERLLDMLHQLHDARHGKGEDG